MKLLNMMEIFFGFSFLFVTQMSFTWFEHDRAAYHVQNQEWEKAEGILQPSLTKNPNEVKTLYGMGILSYKKKEYDRASAYFASALEYETNVQQKEELFYNYGNALAQQKKLQEAIDAYEKALEINPENEQVKHNLEVVKKMLKNQEQQQQQDDQQNQQDKQDKNNDQQQDDQSKQDKQKKQDNNDNSDQSDKNENSDGQQEQNGNQDKQQHEGNAEQDKQKKDERESGNGESEPNQNEQSQDKSGEDLRNEPQQKDGNDKRSNEHGEHDESPKTSDDQSDSSGNDTQEQEKEQEAKSENMHDGIEDTFKELDAHLARILEAQEKKDADLSKQIIKMQVDKQLAGQDGQNCW